ncbi:MAG: hypothetical protein ACI9BW_001801 [Gammaproteobacteria bacterium]|jgi:hypothetical protein
MTSFIERAIATVHEALSASPHAAFTNAKELLGSYRFDEDSGPHELDQSFEVVSQHVKDSSPY